MPDPVPSRDQLVAQRCTRERMAGGGWPQPIPVPCAHARPASPGSCAATSAGGHAGDLSRQALRSSLDERVGQQPSRLLGDGARGGLLTEQPVTHTEFEHCVGIGELVGALGQEQLRQPGPECTEHAAAAAVVHYEVETRQQIRLRDPLFKSDVCRDVAQRGDLRCRPGRDQDIDVEHSEARNGLAQDRDATHCGAQGQVDQRTAPVSGRHTCGQGARLVPADRTQRHAIRLGYSRRFL